MKYTDQIKTIIFIALLSQSLFFMDTSHLLMQKQSENMSYSSISSTFSRSDMQTSIERSTSFPHETLTPGQNKTFAFFTQDRYVNLDADGNVFEWEAYNDVKDSGNESVYANFAVDSDYSYTWPFAPLQYVPLIDLQTGYQHAVMFSPPFVETTYISGKVYFLTYIATFTDKNGVLFTLRIKLWLYDPNNGELTELLVIESPLPYNSPTTQQVFSATLGNTVTVPAGYRLKVTYEASASRIDRAGYLHLQAGHVSLGAQVQWQIDDGVYSNTYVLNDVDTALGVQLYMYDKTYPSISMTGATNNTKYLTEKNITVSTSGAVESYYKWDSESYAAFSSSVVTQLPTTFGWHYLYVQALDEYQNNNTVVYKIGYDYAYINLYNANNGSLVSSGFVLNFSLVGYDSSQYAWDGGGNYTFSSPYDITVPDFSGEHKLSIFTTNVYGENKTLYVFQVDNGPPLVVLKNVNNDTTQPTGKIIDVNITDQTTTIGVLYNWDDNKNSSWSPIESTIYRTYVPNTDGFHWLNVYANDSFGHIILKRFRFNASSSYLLVELRAMINDSYYYGGNKVELSISGTNGTIKFKWDSNTLKDGQLQDKILTLSGIDALPMTLGIHYLTIIVGDVDNNEHTFIFKFTIDQENPVIDNVGLYNNTRLLNSQVLDLEISDNYTTSVQLETWMSIDGGANVSLSSPFDIDLSSLADGEHNISIYTFDIARNNATCIIFFIIDTTAPKIEIISIEGEQTSSSGTTYIPGNATIQCLITDADPAVMSYYSWNNSIYISIINESFVLPDTNGEATLRILANDTLGNQHVLTLNLCIDSTPPNISILFPYNFSKINEATKLAFFVQDSADDTISLLSAKWDQFLEGVISLSPPFFSLYLSSLKKLYEGISTASLYIDVADIVGNSYTYTYVFPLDFEPPTFTLTGALNNSYVRSDDKIYIQNISSDLMNFTYHWGNNTVAFLTEPWIIDIPNDDGEHILTIIVYDDTGEGLYPNWASFSYVFFVDDIGVEYIDPEGFHNNSEITLEYKQSFSFSVNVYDTADNETITGLQLEIINNTLNLLVENHTSDGKTYILTIYATNVGSTDLIFQFSKGGSNKHRIIVNLSIAKKEGSISVLATSTLSVVYEEDVVIILNFEDETSNFLNVTKIFVNSTEIEDFVYLDNISAVRFNYSSKQTMGKGNYTLIVRLESNYYYSEKPVNIEILPIPVHLAVSVSSFSVIEGSQVGITGTLTFLNGTPIPYMTLHFYVYIVYKNQTNTNVFALPSEYGKMVVLSGITNSTGQVTIAFEMTSDMAYIAIRASFGGSQIFDVSLFEMEDYVYTLPPPKLASWILYSIIAGSIVMIVVVSYIVYKLTRPKPFEELLDSIEDEEIMMNLTKVCPGVVLSIFDQRKGAIPLVSDHSLNHDYSGRIKIGTENFLLKISDQAYSSLGFEEHHTGRRTGSITLPNEGLIGFIHGIQLENKTARGGFENLSLIILVDADYGTALIGYQDYLYSKIDDLISKLKHKKPLETIEEQLTVIRHQSVRIVLAAMKEETE